MPKRSPKKRVPDSGADPGRRRQPIEVTCVVCGAKWKHDRKGPRPKYCVDHRPSNNRARDKTWAEANGDHDRAQRIAGLAGSPFGATGGPMPKTVRAALMAAGLHVHPDPRVAADAMGLDVTGEDLEELERLARETWPDVVQGDSTLLHKLLDAQLKAQAIHGALDGRSVPPAQRAQAMQRIAQSIEVLHRHSSTTYAGPVRVELREVASDG